MKKVLIAAVMVAGASAAFADGYVGASVGVAKAGLRCEAGLPCDHNASNPFKIYGGTRIADMPQLSTEVAYIRFGSFQVRRSAEVFDSVASATVASYSKNRVNSSAIVAALAARYEPVTHLSLVGRLGLAYSIASVDQSVMSVSDGAQTGYVSNGSDSSNKIKPYVGVGVEYDVAGLLKVGLSYDWTQYQVGIDKGYVSMWSMGVQKDF